jgi:hypothetical protein
MKRIFIGITKLMTILSLIVGLVFIVQIVPTLLNNDYTIVAVFLVAIISIIKQLQDIVKFIEEKYSDEEYKNGGFCDKFWMNIFFIKSHWFEYSIKFIIYLALVIALILQFKAAEQRINYNIDLNSTIYLLKKQVTDLNASNNDLLKAYSNLNANKN